MADIFFSGGKAGRLSAARVVVAAAAGAHGEENIFTHRGTGSAAEARDDYVSLRRHFVLAGEAAAIFFLKEALKTQAALSSRQL